MSDIRYYTADQVREALPMAKAIDAMRVAFGELSAGLRRWLRRVKSSEHWMLE